MSKNKQDEKSEKDEKDLVKHEEMARDKSVAGKLRRDPLGSVIWAVILIWIGFALLASNVGWQDAIDNFLAQIRFQLAESPLAAPVSQLSAWSLIFLGAGVILLVEVVVRLLFPAYRRPVLGTLILTIILLGIGMNSWIMIWPMVIIVIGLAVIFRGRFGSEYDPSKINQVFAGRRCKTLAKRAAELSPKNRVSGRNAASFVNA